MAKHQGPEVSITLTPRERWEQDIEHDARSKEIYDFISEYDWKFNDDSLDLKSGGDGDNGESLMYLLDEYFAAKDAEDAISSAAKAVGTAAPGEG